MKILKGEEWNARHNVVDGRHSLEGVLVCKEVDDLFRLIGESVGLVLLEPDPIVLQVVVVEQSGVDEFRWLSSGEFNAEEGRPLSGRGCFLFLEDQSDFDSDGEGEMKDQKCDATWEEVEKEVVLIECLIKRLPAEERGNATCRIAGAAVLWAGENFYEQLGVLEEAKMQFRETWQTVMEEEDVD